MSEQIMKVRLFDAASGVETTSEWDESSLAAFAEKINNNPPRDGEIVHCCAYHRVHRYIRNYDRNEIHLYWSHVIGYDPVKEYNTLNIEQPSSSVLAAVWAFIFDPESRQLSAYKYSNGNGMSVREARQLGLVR